MLSGSLAGYGETVEGTSTSAPQLSETTVTGAATSLSVSIPPELTLEEVTRLATADIAEGPAAGPFQIIRVEATLDPDGTTTLRVKLAAASVKVANDRINDPGTW